jgi:hypothetical protein
LSKMSDQAVGCPFIEEGAESWEATRYRVGCPRIGVRGATIRDRQGSRGNRARSGA